MDKILKIGSPNHGFQWFLMVVHHRSNNAMVMVTYHCSSLSYSYYMVFLVSRNWRAVFVSNSFCTKFEEIIRGCTLKCFSAAQTMRWSKETYVQWTVKMEIAQPAKISMLLYMMKIVIKSDAGMHRAAFLDALASLDLKLSVSQSVSESYFFRSSNSESVSHWFFRISSKSS